MRVIAVTLTVLSIVCAGQAFAADKKTQLDKKDRVVCRSITMTGTRFEKRVCKSAGEWEKIAQGQNDEWREQLSRPVINRAAQP